MVFHSSAMRLNFKEGVGYLTFPALESYPLRPPRLFHPAGGRQQRRVFFHESQLSPRRPG